MTKRIDELECDVKRIKRLTWLILFFSAASFIIRFLQFMGLMPMPPR